MNRKATGLATAWLSFALADMGLIDAAIEHSNRALAISEELNSQTIYRESMYGLAKGYLCQGNWKKTLKIGNNLIAYGLEKTDSRALAGGNLFVGAAYLASGDLDAAVDALNQSIAFSPGPTYHLYAKIFLGNCYLSAGKFAEAQGILDEIISFGDKYGLEAAGEPAKVLSGAIMVLRGKPTQGLKLLESITHRWLSNGNRYRYASGELMLGKIYQQFASKRKDTVNPLQLIKNMGFIVRIMPFAGKRAEMHFGNAAELAEQMGARMLLGQACLGLAELYCSSGNIKEAGDFALKAIRAFKKCEAENFLKQATGLLRN
jgi:tetratricopeptide (TPR) repeat protein